jgi:hypothetical protein
VVASLGFNVHNGHGLMLINGFRMIDGMGVSRLRFGDVHGCGLGLVHRLGCGDINWPQTAVRRLRRCVIGRAWAWVIHWGGGGGGGGVIDRGGGRAVGLGTTVGGGVVRLIRFVVGGVVRTGMGPLRLAWQLVGDGVLVVVSRDQNQGECRQKDNLKLFLTFN